MEFFTLIALGILLVGIIIAFWIGSRIGEYRKNREWEKQIDKIRKDAVQKSRSILTGQFSEQLAPYLPNFPFSPSECKFLGKPVDFVVFEGLDEKNVKEIVFVEVKSGKSKLSGVEKSLKDAVKNKKVRWEEYRVWE
jgi:predicted Holliday junction resolvase-like endonuclease